MQLLKETVSKITPLDMAAMASARARQDRLTKPKGSLGRLEEISIKLAGIQGKAVPKIRRKVVVTAAADHGVAKQGVSAYPQAVTRQMVMNFLNGGAAINVLARYVNAELELVDAGVMGDLPKVGGLRKAGFADGTFDITIGPAMQRDNAVRMVEAGIAHGQRLARGGADLIGLGDMGIGNTTPSSAIVACITSSHAADVTGRGTGIVDGQLRHKVAMVEKALAVNSPNGSDGIDVLSKVGGFEIGYLAGVALGAASERGAVVLDGFISTASGLIAHAVCPEVSSYMFASHKSVETGHAIALKHLGLTALMDLDLRLGEGTGAALGMFVIEAAALCLSDMATFDEAGVSDKDAPR